MKLLKPKSAKRLKVVVANKIQGLKLKMVNAAKNYKAAVDQERIEVAERLKKIPPV